MDGTDRTPMTTDAPETSAPTKTDDLFAAGRAKHIHVDPRDRTFIIRDSHDLKNPNAWACDSMSIDGPSTMHAAKYSADNLPLTFTRMWIQTDAAVKPVNLRPLSLQAGC